MTGTSGPAPFRACEILSVGTELLMGQIVNTDAAYLARRLSEIGIPSYRQGVVGDNPERLEQSLREALDRSDCVLLTGGLGPTADDITMEAAARVAGRTLVLHGPSLARIEGHFAASGHAMADSNRKQAMLPEGALVMPNERGTAPGCILEIPRPGGALAALLLFPGPPGEMTAMFEAQAFPYLAARAPYRLRSTYVRLFGIGESQAEALLFDLIAGQTDPTFAPSCSDGEVLFRITRRETGDGAPDPVPALLEEIRRRLGDSIYEIGTRTLPEVVVSLASEKGRTLAFAESCTSGMAASLLASVPGASRCLLGGVVAYADDIKTRLLGVDPSILLAHGAVSEPCAVAMAVGCRTRFGSDLAVSTTGIAGPSGATDTKPTGLVHLALAHADGVDTRTVRLTGGRDRVRHVAALHALDMIRRRLLP